MAGTLDFIVKLVIQNQDAVKKLGDDLKGLKVKPEGIEATQTGFAKIFNTASQVSFGFNNVTQSIQTMIGAARPAYEFLIGANEQLNQQLLKSAASITATSAVSGADDKQLKNIDSIRALQPKLKETLREVEIATQSLVGVTSAQTSEVFNVILTNTGKLNGQLKSATDGAEKFKDPLDAAAKLAPGLVATLGTMGLPIAQASDEISNLLKGEIDSTAQVAKSLGITREMIESYKAQGTLVDELTKKFDPFLKANAEASRSVGGITSNIQDLFEIMGREAGKPLTEGFVSALQVVYEALQNLIPAVQTVFTGIIAQAVTVAKKVADSVAPAFQGLGVAIKAIAPSIGPIIQSIIQNFGNLVSTLQPIAVFAGSVFASIGTSIGAILPAIVELSNTLGSTFQGFVSIAVGVLGPALFVISEGLKFIAGALTAISADPIGKVLIQAVALAAIVGPIALGALQLGAAIAAIAGTAGGVATLGAVIAGLSPGLASAIVAVVGFGSSAVAAFGAAQLAMAPIIAAFTTGGLSAGIGAVGAAVAGLGPAFIAAQAAAAPLLLALAPLIAIGGAIAITLAVKGAKDLENAQTELDALRSTTDDISDNALKNAGKLKALAEAAASGTLSDKQKQDQKDLIFGSKQQLKLIDDQIEAIKKQKQESQGQGASQEQLNQFDIQQKQLESTRSTLSKYADAVKIASQELAILGTANEQIAQKVKGAQGIIDGGVGDPAKFKESAKLLSDLTQKQVELGTITAEEGAKTLAKLQNNTKLDYESQLAAKEAIVKIYQSRFAKIEELQAGGTLSNDAAVAELEQVRSNGDLQLKTRQEAAKKIIALNKETLDAELAELGAQTAKIEAQKAGGGIGEAEAAKQISEVKIKESTKRMEQLRKEAELETNPEVKRKLIADTEKAEAEITKIKADEQNRRNAERLKDFDEQSKVAQAELDKGATTEEAFNEKKRSIDVAQSAEQISQLKEKLGKLKSTDKEGREAIEAQIAEAESKREQNLKAANDREIATLQSKLDKELALVKAAESEKQLAIAQSVKGGNLTREQGDIESAKAAAESAEKAIEAEQKKLDKLRSLPSPNNPKDAEALAKQIADQEGKFADSKLALLKKNGEIEKALVAEIAKANQRAGEEIDAAQQSNKVKVNQQEIEQLRAKVADVEKIARAVAKSELDTERLAATEKFNLKQEELAKLKALIESGQISGPDAIDAERKLQKELADINLQRISLEKKALEELRAEKVRQIELDSQNSLIPLQKRVDLLNEQKSILEQQNSLIAAQQKLEGAVFGLAKQRLGFAIEDAKNSKDEELAKKLEAQAAGEQLAFTRQQNASKIEAIQLSIEQRAIDSDAAQIQAQIATLQAQANLEKAKAEGKSKEQIEALERVVALNGRNEQLLAQSAENQKIVAQKELKAAAIENQTTEEKSIRDLNKALTASDGIERTNSTASLKSSAINPALFQPIAPVVVKPEPTTPTGAKTAGTPTTPVDPAKTATDLDASAKKVGVSLEGTGNAIVEFGNKLRAITAIPSRFTGGPIGAGADFFGAEQGPELAQYGDGTFDLLMRPGIYNLKQGANIIPAQKTQEMIQASALMGGGGNISPIGAVGSGISTLLDGSAIVSELRRLQTIVSSRKPQMNIPVTFSEPSSDGTDRKMAEFSRMLVRSGL